MTQQMLYESGKVEIKVTKLLICRPTLRFRSSLLPGLIPVCRGEAGAEKLSCRCRRSNFIKCPNEAKHPRGTSISYEHLYSDERVTDIVSQLREHNNRVNLTPPRFAAL